MDYALSPVSEAFVSAKSQPLDLAAVPAIVAGLQDGRSIVRVMKDRTHFLELASSPGGILATEQYETECLHRRERLSAAEAVALITRYEKESVSDVLDWYPTLVRWRGLRFGSPRLFALLNEPYRISNPVFLSAVVGIGVVVFVLGELVAMSLDYRGKLRILPFALYALLVAKRIDFVDRRSPRGYPR